MIDARVLWALLIVAQLIVNLPVLIYLVKWRDIMTVSAAAQAIVDELNAAAASLQTAITNAGAAQNTEDLAAIKTAADNLVSAIDTAAQPPAV